MQTSTEIRELFIKFIERQCSPDEVQQVLIYVQSSNKLTKLPSVEEVHGMLDHYADMTDAQADILFNKILKKAASSRFKSYFWKYGVASVFVIFLVSGYFLRNNVVDKPSGNNPILVKTNIEIGTDKAILTLENGEEISLEKENSYLADHISSNGETIIYNSQTTKKSTVVYNYLSIPRGGQFQLQLEDGTKVWLNSETKLKYPVAFMDGQTREVELLYGEAYFEVSPSSKHNGSKFNVKTQSQNVEVLGTEFNIKAYQNDNRIYTTLVEGKVTINRKDKTQNLVPNQQAILTLQNELLEIKEIDVYNEVSWKNGLFSFKGKSLKNITDVLSRWYDIDFEFQNEAAESIKFNGVLQKQQPIEEILTIIKETKFINAYDIQDNKIIIK